MTPLESSGSEALVGIGGLFRDPATGVFTAGRILGTPRVTSAVSRRLRPPLTRQQLLDTTEIRPVQQSSVVAIVAEARSPDRAAAIANTFASVLIEQRNADFQREVAETVERVQRDLENHPTAGGTREGLQQRLADLRSFLGAPDPTVEILSPAIRPDRPSSPRLGLSVTFAFLAALVVALAGTLLIELANPRLANEDELLQRLPVLARVPRGREKVVRNYLRGRASLPADFWEAYRTLRASLAAEGIGERPRSLLVTSAMEREGKTMTSVNLAIAFAAAGARVILVDGDLRRPMVASVFDVEPPERGLAAVLFGQAAVEDVLLPTPGYGYQLRLLLAGSERPIDLLEPGRLHAVLADLKRSADIVVIDSPPVTEFADALALAEAVDTVIVAVRVGHSRRDKFNELRRFLQQNGVTPAGFVVTSLERSRGHGTAPKIEDSEPQGALAASSAGSSEQPGSTSIARQEN